MPGKVIGKVFNLGYSGNISRSSDNIIINRLAGEKVLFGYPVVLNDDNTVRTAIVGDSEEEVIGATVRIVKQETNYLGNETSYELDDAVDIMTRGSMTVICNSGSPLAGGKVYLKEDNGNLVFSAEANGNEQLKNVKFTTGQIDNNRIVEITFTERRMVV